MASVSIYSSLLAYRALDISMNNNTNADPTTWGLLGGGSAPGLSQVSSYIILMKGTVPTDLTAFTVPKYRADTDQLIIFSSGGGRDVVNGSADFYLTTYPAYNKASINTDYVPATASGTATWFLLENYHSAYGISTQIVGTVGAIGSGADMEIETTTIVAGTPYRILGWKLQFPTEWTI